MDYYSDIPAQSWIPVLPPFEIAAGPWPNSDGVPTYEDEEEY